MSGGYIAKYLSFCYHSLEVQILALLRRFIAL